MFPNSTSNLSNIFSEVLKDPRVEIKSSVKKTSSKKFSELITADETFALLLTRVCGTREKFMDVLALLQEMEERQLTATVHKASNQPDVYWTLIEGYMDLSADEIDYKLSGGTAKTLTASFRALQKSLWASGSPVLFLGSDPGYFDEKLSDVQRNVMSDMDEFVNSMLVSKQSTLDGFASKIVKCMNPSTARNYSTVQDRLEMLKDMSTNFSQGKFPYRLNIEKFQTPTEPFLVYPTTLDPKDALAMAIVRLLSALLGSGVVTAFRETDMNQVRRYTGNSDDYVLFSDKEDSPFALECTPALYCSDVEDGIWSWRSVERTVSKQVGVDMLQNGISSDNQSYRDECLKRSLRVHAIKIAGIEEEEVVPVTSPLVEFSSELKEMFPNKLGLVRVYKRGFSTKEEIDENPEFFHVTKATIARQFYTTMKPLMLSDFTSVLLFPLQYWVYTPFYKAIAETPDVLYMSEHGHELLAENVPALNFYFSMLQLSLTFKMFKSWSEGNAFPAEVELSTILTSTLVTPDPSLLAMYVGPFKNTEMRTKLLKKFSLVAMGSFIGCAIAPASSKSGSSKLKKLESETKLVSALSGYDKFIGNYEYASVSDLFDGIGSYSFYDEETSGADVPLESGEDAVSETHFDSVRDEN